LNYAGEPLLHKRIFGLIKRGKEMRTDIEVSIATNATALGGFNSQEIVDSGLDVIYESKSKSKFRNRKGDTHLIRADIFNLPLREDRGAFDAIISMGVLGVHVPVTEGLLSCLRSLLKSDSGRLLFDTNAVRRHWREILTRKVFEFLGRSPDSVLLIWGFPVQPYAEALFMLRRKLKRTGYVVEKVEKAEFAAEGYVVTAWVS